MTALGVLLPGLLLWLSLAGTALAHDPGMTAATLVLEADRSTVEISIKGIDLPTAGNVVWVDGEGRVDSALLEAQAERVWEYIESRTSMSATAQHCEASRDSLKAVEDAVLALLHFDCGTTQPGLQYRTAMLHEKLPQTLQHLLVLKGDQSVPAVLSVQDPALELTLPPGRATLIWRYTKAGVDHLFQGYDHIAFLTALVLWARRFLPLVKVVTAFTIAHAITLFLAATETFSVPAHIVEPVIALTIIIAGFHNLFSRNVSARWRWALFLGLIHGFGFAFALRDLGLSDKTLISALIGFNLGIEIGQLLYVFALVVVLLLVDRLTTPKPSGPQRSKVVVYALSSFIGLLGCYWFIERLAANF